MKKVPLLILFMLMTLLCAYAIADVEINETNFPDECFREYIKGNFDKDDNSRLNNEEIADITDISCQEQSIRSLQGIEFFNRLTRLICYDNKLTEIDISKNPQIVYLDCRNNKLTTLDISNNTKLTQLHCQENRLISLQTGNNTALTQLSCSNNQLTALSVNFFNELGMLRCSSNKLTSLDVSNNPVLNELGCSDNELSTLDVSQNSLLETLGCDGNKISSLDLGNNVILKNLSCENNQLHILDLSKNIGLKSLRCNQNSLASLDVSNNTKLKSLDCSINKLTSLDISKNRDIEELKCQGNKIQKLDVSNCEELCEIVQNNPRRLDDEWDYFGNHYELIVGKDTIVIAGSFTSKPSVIPEQEIVDISKAKISKIPDQEYTGKSLKPTITVKYDGKTLTEGEDFSVKWKDNKKPGKATVTITGNGYYKGTKSSSFKINPQSVELSSLKEGKKSLTVKWKKGKSIDGYEIQYSLKSNFKSAKKMTVSGASTKKAEIDGLKKKKTYYVRIRAFKEVDGKKYYSEWSNVLEKKTK